MWQTKKIKKQA